MCIHNLFLKIGATNRGLEIYPFGGITRDSGIEIEAAYKSSLTKEDKPKILIVSVGKQILLTDYDKDNKSITPSVGYGYLRGEDCTGFYVN